MDTFLLIVAWVCLISYIIFYYRGVAKRQRIEREQAKKWYIDKLSHTTYLSEILEVPINEINVYNIGYIQSILKKYGFEARICADRYDWRIWPINSMDK